MQALHLLFSSDFGLFTVIFFALMLAMAVYFVRIFSSRNAPASTKNK